ncbi:hypothetical protein HMPREF9946_00849 [Acetobacteraceae bacterium AT-5844]|nr:hypothetical protein HMPREF9946_00849 [Acetobacteraceae bacterium AT-5844]
MTSPVTYRIVAGRGCRLPHGNDCLPAPFRWWQDSSMMETLERFP